MHKLWKKVTAVVIIAAIVVMSVVPAFAQTGSGLLGNIPVVGTLDGGTFEGVLSVTGFAIENGQLVVNGVLEGTAVVDGVTTEITQTFSNILASLLGGGGRCRILELDLGPIFLDLLGSEVDLAEVNLDIVAQSGAGKLLGNLLCAVAGLLDSGGPLSAITNLLNQINNLL